MILSLDLVIRKHLNDRQIVTLVAARWQDPFLPSFEAFCESVRVRYESIELPWFPYDACASVNFSNGFLKFSASEPVDEPDKVARELWEMIRYVDERFDQEG